MARYPDVAASNRKSSALAHLLFLTNITVLPVISFILLLITYNRNKARFDSEVLHHYRQSIIANIISGILLILVSAAILGLGSFDSVYTWMWLILYFTCIHSVLIFLAVLGLVKAQAGKRYSYPLFGNLWH